MSDKSALVIIVNGVEETEAVAPIDILRRAGVSVVVASASGTELVTGRDEIQIKADCRLEEVTDREFDLVVIPGGPGHKELLENKAVLELAASQNKKGGFIGSICAGPVVLKEAGVLDGRRYTSFPGTAEQLPERDPDALVVVDGNLVTSQGAGTAVNFGLSLVESLFGTDKAKEIAESICFPSYPFG